PLQRTIRRPRPRPLPPSRVRFSIASGIVVWPCAIRVLCRSGGRSVGDRGKRTEAAAKLLLEDLDRLVQLRRPDLMKLSVHGLVRLPVQALADLIFGV